MGLAAIGTAATLAMGGATAIGATATAIAAGTMASLSLGTVLTAVATVGSVLGTIGAVAGIDELKTAGMVIGGIGAVGSLANAVGAFGDAATVGSVFGGESAASAVSGQATANSLINGSVTGNMADADALDPLYQGASAASTVSGDSLDIVSATNKMAGSLGVPTPSTQTPAVADTAKPAGTSTTNSSADPLSATKETPKLGDVQTNKDSGKSYSWDGKQWVPEAEGMFSGKNAAMLGMGAIQSAGSFISGAFDPLKPAQAAAYTAQANANNAQAALSQKELSNMNGNIPVARRLAVTGRPSVINGAPA